MSRTAFHFVLPGPPETPTGGFVYDREMLRALAAAGRLGGRIVLPDGFPVPSPATLAAAGRALAALPEGAQVVIDGLALTPLAEASALDFGRLRVYALIHHALGDEAGLPPLRQRQLHAAERRALSQVDGIVVTSAHTAQRLGKLFELPAARIRVVRPGIHPPRGGRPRPAGRTDAYVLLCVASLTPRKGQDVLLRALARLRRAPWRLRLVGPVRNARFARHLRRLADRLGVGRQVEFAGAVDAARLAWHYRQAHVFVLPSRYEGFGIAAAEAAAHGLPVVATAAGALPEALAGTRHRLVPADDPPALARALRPFLAPPFAAFLTEPAGGARRPRSWAEAGRDFIAALDVLSSGAARS